MVGMFSLLDMDVDKHLVRDMDKIYKELNAAILLDMFA